jgi:hypothetical protein
LTVAEVAALSQTAAFRRLSVVVNVLDRPLGFKTPSESLAEALR